MALMTEQLRDQLKKRFADRLMNPVQLRLFVKPSPQGLVLPSGAACPACSDARELLGEVQQMAPDQISLEVINVSVEPDRAAEAGIEDVPTLVINRPSEPAGIRFQGLPAGYEFSTLIDAIERVSRGAHDLSAANVERLKQLTAPVEIMVFVTPSCPYCPAAASLAGRMALASPQVRATTVEVSEYPEMIREYRVQGVPRIVVNRTGAFVGALPEDQFVASVLKLAGTDGDGAKQASREPVGKQP